MSISISSSNSAGLPGAPIPQPASVSTGQTGASSSNAIEATATLLPRLDAMVASMHVNQLEVAFGQALQSATAIDPSSGQREMSANADKQLSAALNQFLVQSGFTQQQADAASAGFEQQLAGGGPISFTASYAGTSTDAFSVSAGYGSQAMSASGVSVNERSGSVSIEFDPTTGALSVSLEDQRVSATQSVMQGDASGALMSFSLPPASVVTVSSHDGSDSDAAGSGTIDSHVFVGPVDRTAGKATTAGSATPDDASGALNGLIAGLAHPTLHGTRQALDLLGRIASAAQTESEAANRAARATQGGRPQSAAVTLGFTQPLSIARRDERGHGAALFKRPDGGTGAISFKPTNIEA
ncbi:hypothetical protein [Paraburkholderia solisilvae]|uniref:Uncharacterized protein n=1 Tax=Paraburkholderia solisilvae TaxID=624376 RepID=A0A6J5EDB3_9BURK|nr:hypothetical protein [Paraburkholderia solisilvae]CAB3763624.1 hypothetical protein LMG29739_04146 [Paraburkholderia solisilvae]